MTLQRCVLCLPGQPPTCGGLISNTITPLTAALQRITHHTLHAVTGRFLQQYHAYLALPGMSLHELVCFKFFLLVWHNSWHLEQEPRLLRHLRLLAVLLGVGVVVGGAGGGVEHVRPVMGWLAPRPVLPAVPVGVAVGGRAEGEHVEGGGGGAVQHPGPHQPHRAGLYELGTGGTAAMEGPLTTLVY